MLSLSIIFAVLCVPSVFSDECKFTQDCNVKCEGLQVKYEHSVQIFAILNLIFIILFIFRKEISKPFFIYQKSWFAYWSFPNYTITG